MAVHLLRDYQNQTAVGNVTTDQLAYFLVIFMRRILGYTVVGQTNFDIDSATYLVASGTSSPDRAGINFGAGAFYEVSIPVGVRTVVGGDVGKMLVLKSTANPRFNSGVFLITGINAGSNRYIVNWRSGDVPPVEAADSIQWWLHNADNTYPATRGANAGTGYRSFGSSTCSRIILQSPHVSAWQVRICMESSTDYTTNGTTVHWTYAPGYGGNSSGDFPAGGDHLHSVLWWDTATTTVAQMPGMSCNTPSGDIYRTTMVGDEEGTGVCCIVRRVTTAGNWMFQFGLCESEPTPLPVKNVRRLWTMGHNVISGGVSVYLAANNAFYHGIAQGFNGQPVSANIANWTHIETNTAVFGGPYYNLNAADNPFTGSTDLIPVEIAAGVTQNFYGQVNNRIHQYEPRILGTVPFVRQGRTNFGNYTLTTDVGKSWQHFVNGIFMMWGGPAVLA